MSFFDHIFTRHLPIVIPWGKDKSIQVGPWHITCEIDEIAEVQQLERKAVPSWDEFMKGIIQYYLEMPLKKSGEIANPTIVEHFCKLNRPKAWKGTDLRIEQTIPVIGNDFFSDNMEGECQLGKTPTIIVKVAIQLRLK